MTKIFLIRHATPDLSLKHIPYVIHPGPPLLPKGEQEAEALAEFLDAQGVVKLYYSPFERSSRTAQIVSMHNAIPGIEDLRLTEWRSEDETAEKVSERMSLVFDEVVKESAGIGSIGLVSHGGPIALLLLALGMDKDKLAQFKRKFDSSNPLPPAGVWAVEWNDYNKLWDLELLFIPSTSEKLNEWRAIQKP
jgi:broad specificity phosphatase PhoE